MIILDSNSILDNQDLYQELYKQKFNINNTDFKFDKFQLLSFIEIDKNNNVLVSAPTSSGKTSIAEYALINCINNNKKIIYTSPIKSLSNEKYKEFKDRNICNVGLLTGDNKINIDADCVIMTAEILRNSLYKTDTFDDNIGCVIMDEVHFINDPDRGKIWEETIIMLPQHIQLIMLSATINNVEDFANWIHDIRDNNLSLIKSSKRIVPLNYYIYSETLYKILDNYNIFNDNNYYNAKKSYDKILKDRKINHKSYHDPCYFNKVVKYLIKNDLLQSIFFSFSRANCEKYAKSISPLLTSDESINAINMFDHLMRKYYKDYEIIPQYHNVKDLIQKGVCFHHSGLIPIIKEIIEILFRNGFIKVLFATETFAVGVNMPTRTVVFTELTKPTNMTKRFLNTAEFKQMSGRAGRRGKDVIGHVILLPYYDFPELFDLKNVMLNSMPSISSKFSIDYYHCLKTINMNDNIYNKSLLNCEQNNFIKSITYNLENILSNSPNIINFTEQQILSLDKQYKLENILTNSFIKLSKQQIKELKTLQSNNKEFYQSYLDIIKYNNNIDKYKNDIEKTKNYCNSIYNIILNILIKENYVINNPLRLDIYGIAIINCNECNGIIITEIIKNNILDNMSSSDIISFMSIFVSYKKEGYSSGYYKDEYKLLNNIIDKWTDYEIKNQLNINPEFWEITNGYFDIVYDWITLDIDDKHNMALIIEHLRIMDEYEGNFIKNMLKVYNICVCLKNILEMLNKLDIVLKLQDLDKKILKNIVNVNSLYLN